MSHFDHVNADIDQRTAALKFLLTEDTPVRNTAATQCLTFHKHQITELTAGFRVHQVVCLGIVAVLETDCQLHVVLLRCGNHLFAFFRRHCHGLFNHHVATGIGCGNRCGHVNAVRSTDVDGIRLHCLEHVIPLFKAHFRSRTILLLDVFQTIRLDVAVAHNFHFRNLGVRCHVGRENTAATDKCHAQFLRRCCLFRGCLLRRSFFRCRCFRRCCLLGRSGFLCCCFCHLFVSLILVI